MTNIDAHCLTYKNLEIAGNASKNSGRPSFKLIEQTKNVSDCITKSNVFLSFLKQEIGHGRYGVVYPGHLYSGDDGKGVYKKVAVKSVRLCADDANLPSAEQEPKQKAISHSRFMQEVEALRKYGQELRPISAWIVSPTRGYIAETIGYGDLLSWRKKCGAGMHTKPISIQCLTDINNALVCLHKDGIQHGNIRPKSITVLVEQRKFVLNDFGSVSTEDNHRAYSAPEQVDLNIKTITRADRLKTDIFALGTTIVDTFFPEDSLFFNKPIFGQAHLLDEYSRYRDERLRFLVEKENLKFFKNLEGRIRKKGGDILCDLIWKKMLEPRPQTRASAQNVADFVEEKKLLDVIRKNPNDVNYTWKFKKALPQDTSQIFTDLYLAEGATYKQPIREHEDYVLAYHSARRMRLREELAQTCSPKDRVPESMLKVLNTTQHKKRAFGPLFKKPSVSLTERQKLGATGAYSPEIFFGLWHTSHGLMTDSSLQELFLDSLQHGQDSSAAVTLLAGGQMGSSNGHGPDFAQLAFRLALRHRHWRVAKILAFWGTCTNGRADLLNAAQKAGHRSLVDRLNGQTLFSLPRSALPDSWRDRSFVREQAAFIPLHIGFDGGLGPASDTWPTSMFAWANSEKSLWAEIKTQYMLLNVERARELLKESNLPYPSWELLFAFLQMGHSKNFPRDTIRQNQQRWIRKDPHLKPYVQAAVTFEKALSQS